MEIPTCRWCERTVNPEECYADMVVDDHGLKWICGCGEDVTQKSETFMASSS